MTLKVISKSTNPLEDKILNSRVFYPTIEERLSKLDDIKPNFSVNRDLDAGKVAAIKKEIQETGEIKPLFMDKGGLVDGHHRYAALKELEAEMVPVFYFDGDLKNVPEFVRRALAEDYGINKESLEVIEKRDDFEKAQKRHQRVSKLGKPYWAGSEAKNDEDNNSLTFSAEEIQDIQSEPEASSDVIFDMKKDDKFVQKIVPIEMIDFEYNIGDYKNLDEDITIISSLMESYGQDRDIPGIVIDENGEIMDGIHRFIAQKELGFTKIPVFVRKSSAKTGKEDLKKKLKQLEEEHHRLIKERASSDKLTNIVKRKKEVSKQLYPVIISVEEKRDLYGKPIGFYGDIDFWKANNGWYDATIFHDNSRGFADPNELGKKLGVHFREGGGSSHLTFTPTIENIKKVESALKKAGYKVEIKKDIDKSLYDNIKQGKISKEDKEKLKQMGERLETQKEVKDQWPRRYSSGKVGQVNKRK